MHFNQDGVLLYMTWAPRVVFGLSPNKPYQTFGMTKILVMLLFGL
jgi:hypothetical protein